MVHNKWRLDIRYVVVPEYPKNPIHRIGNEELLSENASRRSRLYFRLKTRTTSISIMLWEILWVIASQLQGKIHGMGELDDKEYHGWITYKFGLNYQPNVYFGQRLMNSVRIMLATISTDKRKYSFQFKSLPVIFRKHCFF